MDKVDETAVQAAQNTKLMEDFIRKNEGFILKCASSAVHRYVSKSDDEWSIALAAFCQAVQDYSLNKGRFLSFAKLVMQRKLIDYYRGQEKHRMETPVNPAVIDCGFDEESEEGEDLAVRSAVINQIHRAPDNSLALEIEAANQMFASYGFSFFDLADCSPKAEKTKKACATAAAYIIRNNILLNDMKNSKLLPLKVIEKNAHVPRKILERHRKYIIAAVEIMTGDYPFLAEYMRFIREELNK